MFAVARAGHAWAQQAVGEMVDYLSLAIANVSALLNPELVILGGSVARSADLLIEPILRRLEGVVPYVPRLVASPLGHQAAVMGAIMLVLNAFNTKEKVVDPGTANWFVDELLNGAFTDKYAMNFTWVSFAGAMDNPAISQTAGKWAYAPFPCYVDPATGTKRCAATYGSQGIGINKYSKNKDAAWKYLEWLLSKDTQQKLVDDPRAGFASARVDLFDYQTKTPGTAKWASLTSVTGGWAFDVWTYPEYAQLLDIQQNYINLAYIGAAACKDALNQIATLHQRILDTSPNNPKNK